MLFVTVKQFTTDSVAAQACSTGPCSSKPSSPYHMTHHKSTLHAHRLQTHSRGRDLQECTPGSRILGNLLKLCLPLVKSSIRRCNRLWHFHSYPTLKKSHVTPSRALQRRGIALMILLGSSGRLTHIPVPLHRCLPSLWVHLISYLWI